MEITETVKLKNLPQDIKLVDSIISSAYSEFITKNADINIREIYITFVGGKPSKEITREVK